MTKIDQFVETPRWWNRATGRLLAFILGFFMVWSVRAIALAPLDRQIGPPIVRQLYLDGIRLLLWVVPVLLYVRIVERGDGATAKLLKLSTPIAWTSAFRALIVYFSVDVWLINSMGGRRVASPLEFGPDRWIALFLTMAGACFAEELFFRGFLLPRLVPLMGFWKGNALSSVLFATIHWPGWLAHTGVRADLVVLSFSVFALGLLLGYILKVTNSLWPCVVVHWLNNALASLVVPG